MQKILIGVTVSGVIIVIVMMRVMISIELVGGVHVIQVFVKKHIQFHKKNLEMEVLVIMKMVKERYVMTPLVNVNRMIVAITTIIVVIMVYHGIKKKIIQNISAKRVILDIH